MVKRARKRTGRGRGVAVNERGVALIMVTAVIAILTAVTVEFTYRERVNMHLAANARDELRAYYLAKSAVNLSRLVLSFQRQLDNIQIPGLSQIMSLVGGAPGTAPPTGATPQPGGAAPQGLGIRLWELVPVDCGLVQMFMSMAGASPEPEDGEADEATASLVPFGAFEGGCHAEVNDEESKINVNQLVGLGSQTKATLLELMSLMGDPRYDFLFDEEDAHGIRMTRMELVVALRDYLDANAAQENMVMAAEGPEFVPGAGDETYYYARMRPSYEPKNAALDSLDELYLVAGFGDHMMSAFGDKLTVYTDKNAKLNVTPKSPLDLCRNLVIASRDPNLASRQCMDPVLMTNLWEQVQLQRAMLPFIGLSPQSFRSMLESAGVDVNPFIWDGPSALFGNSSRTFTIEATGQAGEIEKTVVAVVRMDGSNPLGRLLHWEER